MNETPTPEQMAKLPKWAQEYIKDLDRRTVVAERNLKEWQDNQTPSEFYIENYGEGRVYIQTHKMTVNRNGLEVTILLRQDEKGVDISWSDETRISREVAMVPQGFGHIRIMLKQDMR